MDNLTVDDFILLTIDEAFEKYELGDRLFEELDSENKVKYYNGNLIIDGDFILSDENNTIAGYLIAGKLEVKGNILDNSDAIIFLNVKDEVIAENIVLKAGVIYFEDKVNVKNYIHISTIYSFLMTEELMNAKALILYKSYSSLNNKLKGNMININSSVDNSHNFESYFDLTNLKEILIDELFDESSKINNDKIREYILSNKNILKK